MRASRPSDHMGLAEILASLLGQERLSDTLSSALNTNLLRLLSQPGGTLLVAEDENGKLLGFVSLWSHWGLFEDTPTALLDALMVHPDWRGSSAPQALLEQAIGAAQALGCGGLEFVPGEGSLVPEKILLDFGFKAKAKARYTLTIV